jgi:hypothetical protein
MSTELKAPTATITASRFSAQRSIGGTGIQLTKETRKGFDTLQLSRGEALLVAQTLLAFGLGNEEVT